MKYIVKRQESISDCGPCCLYSIIRYYNGYVPLEIIKNDTNTTSDGTTFYNLKEAAVKYGFEVQGIKSSIISNFPCIVQLKLDNGLYHFVVLYQITSDTYICMDPSSGIKKYSKDEFERLFTSNHLYLKPTQNIIKYQKNNHFINLIINTIRKNIKLSILVAVLNVFIIIISLISTYLIKIIIQNYSLFIIMLFILLFIIKNLCNYIKNINIAILNKIYTYNLIYDYLSYYFYLPFKYLQLKSIGEITARFSDLKNLKDFIVKEIGNILISIIMVITILVIFLIINNLIAIYLLLLSIMYALIIYYLSHNSFNIYNNILDSEANLDNITIEYLSKIITIKNFVKENFFLNKLSNIIEENNEKHYELEKHLNNISLFMNLHKDISLILLIIVCLITKESVDNILIYILYYNYYLENINYIISLIPHLEYFKSLFNKINGLYYIEQEKQNKGTLFINNDIDITNLKYNINTTTILNGINIHINQNDKVLLIGDNGSGKSTLLSCLTNNIDNYQGTIKIGNNLKDINNISLKQNISLTMQNDSLFEETIKNNIILDKEFDKVKFNTISKLVALNKIIKKKGGINTIIKDNLSGGERQIIILARSLYQDGKILLFDESLSEISFKLRKKIINNINNHYKDKTIIYISHYYEKCNFNQIIDLTARKEKGINVK